MNKQETQAERFGTRCDIVCACADGHWTGRGSPELERAPAASAAAQRRRTGRRQSELGRGRRLQHGQRPRRQRTRRRGRGRGRRHGDRAQRRRRGEAAVLVRERHSHGRGEPLRSVHTVASSGESNCNVLFSLSAASCSESYSPSHWILRGVVI